MIRKPILLLFIFFQLVYSIDTINIIATANVHGEIDPCGWKKKPLGGLARKATILEQYNNEDNLYVVDAGNLFFSSETLEPGIATEIALINADIILNSFNKMGCNAFSPGSKDFSAGKEFMLSSSKDASFPFVSCNIFDSSRNLLFEPYIMSEQNGIRVAFIGLTSIFESEGLIVEDPLTSLNAILDEVVAISDIRVLLFSSNDMDMKQLEKADLELTMIIRSRNKQRSSDGGSGVPTYTLGDKGKLLYKFDLEVNSSSLNFVDIAWCDRTVEDSNNRLDKMKKGNMLIDLEKEFNDNPSALNRVLLYKSRIEQANQRLENAVNKIILNKIELGRDVNGNVEILQIVDKGKLEIKKNTTPQFDVPHDHDGDGYPDH